MHISLPLPTVIRRCWCVRDLPSANRCATYAGIHKWATTNQHVLLITQNGGIPTYATGWDSTTILFRLRVPCPRKGSGLLEGNVLCTVSISSWSGTSPTVKPRRNRRSMSGGGAGRQGFRPLTIGLPRKDWREITKLIVRARAYHEFVNSRGVDNDIASLSRCFLH